MASIYTSQPRAKCNCPMMTTRGTSAITHDFWRETKNMTIHPEASGIVFFRKTSWEGGVSPCFEGKK